jgi:tetratricopeptide (TPR) repeat protein
MEKEGLLESYEATGDEQTFAEARRLYEQALAEGADAQALAGYGYLLQCHGSFSLRQAVAQYERAIELDPGADKPHYQLIGARAMLGEPERAIDLYRKRLAAAPAEIREYRFLANAYIATRQFEEAGGVVDTGLELAPDDPTLIECRGDVRAGTGDPAGALADWRRALELNPENLSPVYSSAFLLEREGRLPEAVEAWRFIIERCDERGWELTAAWPTSELARLQGRQTGGAPLA